MALPPQYVRYSEGIDVKQPQEDGQIRQVVESMGRVQKLMFEKHRHAIRDAHAQSHGILKGELQIYDNLPEPYEPESPTHEQTPAVARLTTNYTDSLSIVPLLAVQRTLNL